LDLAAISQQTATNKIEEGERLIALDFSLLQNILLAWVPVACYDVKSARESILNVFATSRIPVLAMYGSNDVGGEEAAYRLVDLAEAKTVKLGTNHACYLDEPDKFVVEVKSVFSNLGSWWEQ